MRLVFGKYLVLSLIGIVIEVIVVVTALVQTFRLTSNVAQSIFNTILRWEITLAAFSFIAGWAEVLSIFAVCLVLAALFANFKNYRRLRALVRLHDWARRMVLVLAQYRQRELVLKDSPSEWHEEARTLIDKLKANCRMALAEAQVLGGELNASIKKSVSSIFAIDEKVEKQDDTAFEDLWTLQHNLAEIMIAIFESLQKEKYRDIRSLEMGQNRPETNTK